MQIESSISQVTTNRLEMSDQSSKLAIIEPFCGGSHAQLIRLLEQLAPQAQFFTLPAKKWKWRLRTSSFYFSSIIPNQIETLFCSSMLNLAELIGLFIYLFVC